jgi:hypothetical protein
MKTNHRNMMMQDDLEVDDLGKNRFNGLAMLLGVFIPLIVFMFLVLRTSVDLFAKKLATIVMAGSPSDSRSAARSATAPGR